MGYRTKKTEHEKSIYEQARGKMTREEAALKASSMGIEFSPEKIERIENGRLSHSVRPEDVVDLSKIYDCPLLCEDYCDKVCLIGKEKHGNTSDKSLKEIAFEALYFNDQLTELKQKLFKISIDGAIDEEEWKDFMEIRNTLQKLADSVQDLHEWVKRGDNEGLIPEEAIKG